MNTIPTAMPHATRLSLLLGFSSAALLLSAMPAAAGLGDVICNAIAVVLIGSLGRGLATLGVLMLGIGAMFGKVSYGLAVTVAVGIAVMYSAPGLTRLITNDPFTCGA